MKVSARYTYQAEGTLDVEVPEDAKSEEITEQVDKAIRDNRNFAPGDMLAISWRSPDRRFGGRTY